MLEGEAVSFEVFVFLFCYSARIEESYEDLYTIQNKFLI